MPCERLKGKIVVYNDNLEFVSKVVNGFIYLKRSYGFLKVHFRFLRYGRKDMKRKLIEIYGGKCMKCGSEDNITIDHITPFGVKKKVKGKCVRKGSISDMKNVQILCNKCNNEKGIQIIDYRPFKIEEVMNVNY